MPDRPTRPRAWLIFFASWALFAALSALWSLATPIAASPDEPAHLVKAAAVVRGQFITPENEHGSIVEVPRYIAWTHAMTCPAFNDEVTADCIEPVEGDPAELVTATTTAGRYNPVYYLLVGWPSLIVGQEWGVYAMRIVSGVLVSSFLAAALAVLASWTRRLAPVIGFGAGVTPMVLFLSGSVNPNGLEIAATLAAFVAVVAVILRPDPHLLATRAALVAVAGALAANARAISPVWLAIALLVPLLLVTREQRRPLLRSRAVLIAAAVVVVATIGSLIWLRATSSVSTVAGSGGEAPEVPYAGASFVEGLALMGLRFAQHLQEMIGVFGWLDTGSPAEVYALWGLLFGSLVVWTLALARGRSLAFAATLLVAVPVVPAVIQAAFITNGGWIWQGRYALPVLVIAMLGLGIVLADAAGELAWRTQAILGGIAAIIWAFCHVLAFTTALQRYAVGAGVGWLDMLRNPDWQPPGGLLPLLLAFAALTIGTAVLGWRLAVPRREELALTRVG